MRQICETLSIDWMSGAERRFPNRDRSFRIGRGLFRLTHRHPEGCKVVQNERMLRGVYSFVTLEQIESSEMQLFRFRVFVLRLIDRSEIAELLSEHERIGGIGLLQGSATLDRQFLSFCILSAFVVQRNQPTDRLAGLF